MTRKEAINWLKAISFVSDHRITEAIDMAIEALSANATIEKCDIPHYSKTTTDLISRAEAIEAVCQVCEKYSTKRFPQCTQKHHCVEIQNLLALPSADAEQVTSKLKNPCDSLLIDDSGDCKEQKSKLESADAEWIPCSERLPKELEQVNVTWLNHNPPAYYQHLKDIPQVDTAIYYNGAWYWWDATITDVLAEFGERCGAEKIDKRVEIVAWMPMPKPYGERRES